MRLLTKGFDKLSPKGTYVIGPPLASLGHQVATHATDAEGHENGDDGNGQRADQNRIDALEVVTLHYASESLAFAGSHDINLLAGLEHRVNGDLLANGVVSSICGANGACPARPSL